MRRTGPRSLPLRFFRGDIADKVYADAHDWPRVPPRRASIERGAACPKPAWCWSVWPTKLTGWTPLRRRPRVIQPAGALTLKSIRSRFPDLASRSTMFIPPQQ